MAFLVFFLSFFFFFWRGNPKCNPIPTYPKFLLSDALQKTFAKRGVLRGIPRLCTKQANSRFFMRVVSCEISSSLSVTDEMFDNTDDSFVVVYNA